MNERKEIVNIKVDNLYPHPENPRKQIGDISEMVESVKKNGIMQNLTVIPVSSLKAEPEQQLKADEVSSNSHFHVLIGHRRLAAAKAAGLDEVPCRIVSEISLREQVSIMLEENMQRNDLTIYEQAQGFQMMLDLGETADTISEKTGFSKTTVYHRLNLAKLDTKILQGLEKDDAFQLSLKDLYELEKVQDVNKRNEILKEARSSNDISWKAKNAADAEKRQKFLEDIAPLMQVAGIKKAPKSVENERWYGKWDTLKEYNMHKELPEEINVKAKKTDELFYVQWGYDVCVIRKKQETKAETKVDKERREKEQRQKELKQLAKQLQIKTKDYIRMIVEGKIAPQKDTDILRKQILDAAIKQGFSFYRSSIINFYTQKDGGYTEEEAKEAYAYFDRLTFNNQMLVVIWRNINESPSYITWLGEYVPEYAENHKATFDFLELYGFELEEEEKQLLDGTHELYEKEE